MSGVSDYLFDGEVPVFGHEQQLAHVFCESEKLKQQFVQPFQEEAVYDHDGSRQPTVDGGDLFCVEGLEMAPQRCHELIDF